MRPLVEVVVQGGVPESVTVVPDRQPQLCVGVGLALTERVVAPVIALVILVESYPCTEAYCPPACAAP